MTVGFEIFGWLEIADLVGEGGGGTPSSGGGEAAAGGGESGDDAKPGGMFGGMFPFLIMMFGVMIVFMLFSNRPAKKEQAKRKEMLDLLKKNDRVLTAGGIVGAVMNVEKDKDFVTLKIDETTNARMKVLRSSIARVLTDEDKKGINEKDS